MESGTVDSIGIIYPRDTAENIYGSVQDSTNINSSFLSSIISESGEYIMFSFSKGVLLISDEKRKPIHPQDAEFSTDLVFHYFSSSKLLELLKSGDAFETSIELRRDVLTLTNGNYTLENSRPCPPYCP